MVLEITVGTLIRDRYLMKNNQIIFSCSKCGAQYPKWQGRCLECDSWGTLSEEIATVKSEIKNSVLAETPINLASFPLSESKELRLSTRIEELDRVLGGGIVSGSFILLGGDPGIGKSTMALQALNTLKEVLYASGEESASQINSRILRLKIEPQKVNFLPQTDIDKIIATASELKPQLLIIDSIQTVYSQEASGSAGSVSQITACASKLMGLAKTKNISVLVIGHVTKDGSVAGPKTLEHLVDTVLYLENDANNCYRILRAVKNRFGSIGEIGVFEMSGEGLREIADPSQAFIDKELDIKRQGIATTIAIEGSRPFLIEIQALTAKTFFGYPQRRANGFDLNRLQMLLAVLMKNSKINLSNHDVYVNVAGGFKIKETSADLAVCLAITSAFLEKPLPAKTIILGEVGLSGEIRSVSQIERRISEAEKMGFISAIVPESKKPLSKPKLKILNFNGIEKATNIIK